MSINYSDIPDFEDNNEPTADNSDVVNEKDWFDPLDFSPENLEREVQIIEATRLKAFLELPDDAPATVIETKKTIEVVTYTNKADGKGLRKIKKLPNNMFLNTETGEIFKGKKNTKRTGSNTNLNKSIKMVRKLIEDNFDDNEGFYI